MTLNLDATHKSPNHSSREGTDISMIVLHATVGSGPSSLSWLCNPQPDHPDARVSTHYLIYKTGKIYQLVDDSEASWHAGKSAWKGLNSAAIQKCSIGVELENANTGRDPYPKAQMDALFVLCQDKIARYHITQDMVVRHLDIATPKGRKSDPAGFPFARFIASLYVPTFPKLYRANKEAIIFEASNGQGKLFPGTLHPGELVQINMTYPEQTAHLLDGRGFVRMADLDEVH